MGRKKRKKREKKEKRKGKPIIVLILKKGCTLQQMQPSPYPQPVSPCLEVETESHFQPEFRTVFIYIPVHGRFDSYRTREEKCVTAFHAEAETRLVTAVPVIMVQVDISAQEYTDFLDVVTSAHTQRIDIRTAALPLRTGIYQQRKIIHNKRTAFGFQAEMGFVRFCVIREVKPGNCLLYTSDAADE